MSTQLRKQNLILLFCAAFCVMFLWVGSSAHVDCVGDENSLRSAMSSALAGSTIYVCSGTIVLTGGELVIDKSLMITGQGSGSTTISGNHNSRVFFVNPGVSGAVLPPLLLPVLRIANLTIANGNATGGAGTPGIGGGGGAAGLGGGLFINRGAVTLEGVTFSGNTAVGGGGGFSQANSGSAGGGGGGVGGSGPTVCCTAGMLFGWIGGPGGSLGGFGGANGDFIDGFGEAGGEGAGGSGRTTYGGTGGSGGYGGGGGGGFVVGSYGGPGGFGGGGGGGFGHGEEFRGLGGSFGGKGGDYGGGGGGGAGLGGAIFMRLGTLNLINDTFSNNSAVAGLGAGGFYVIAEDGQGEGGAVFISEGMTAYSTNSTFSDNSATDGDNDIHGDLITNSPPTANAGGPYTETEGSPIAMSGATATDPDPGDTLSYSWSVNSAACAFDNPKALAPNLTCAGNGSYTATLNVSDGVNPPVTSVAAISVTYNFNGFFQPVDNLPIVNVVAAGQAIPLKFSLNGDKGLNIFVAGYPSSSQTVCGTSATSDIEETVLPSSSSLSYDTGTDRYIYVWKTDKAWKGSCRLLFVRFNDGGPAHTASFKFK